MTAAEKKPNEFWIYEGEYPGLAFDLPDPLEASKRTHVIEYSAYEQVVKERDEARSKLDEVLSYLPKVPTQPYEKRLAQEIQAERAKSAKLLKALKLECCCTGERSELAPYDYITCDACDTVAEYESKSTQRKAEK